MMVQNKAFSVQFLSIVIAACLLATTVASAQNGRRKIKYGTINEVSLLSGERGEALAVQTINGIATHRWFAGVGTGLDFYGYRSIPLFLDVRHNFSSSKNTPFVYVDAGTNFLWLTNGQKLQLQSPSQSSGLYYDLGFGWKLSGKNNRGFIVSAGYSLKHLSYKLPSYFPAPLPQMQASQFEKYDFSYRRLSVKIGFQL